MDRRRDRDSIDTPKRARGLISLAPPLVLGLLGAALVCLSLGLGDAVLASSFLPPVELALHPQSALETHQIEFTKTVQPLDPDTGGTISVCIAVSGHSQQVDLVLAQDVSTSMRQPTVDGGTRLAACQSAAGTIVDSLPSRDRIAVVAYNRFATLKHGLTTDRVAISDTIAGLTITSKGTNIGEAIYRSHYELSDGADSLPNTLKTIIVLSDGFATCDEDHICTNTENPAILARAKAYVREQAALAAADGVRIYTIGFGDTVDAELLQEIATLGRGAYYGAPDEDTLRTIYQTIVDELRGLSVTDVLVPGLETDCALLPGADCTLGPGGITTVTWDLPSPDQAPDPAQFCLTATTALDPGYQGPSNLPGSEVCYTQSDGATVCEALNVPILQVGGRKISGRVFYDLDGSGAQDPGEPNVADWRVRSDTGWSARTDAQGAYLWRTSSSPALALSVDLREGYTATTPIPQLVPAVSGIYTRNFGVRGTKTWATHLPVIVSEYPLPAIVNGGFEDGWTGWRHGGQLRQSIASTSMWEGGFSALLGDPVYPCMAGVPLGSGWIEQTVYVPRSETRRLAFRYNLYTQDTNPGQEDAYDSFDVTIDGELVFREARTSQEYGCAPQNLEAFGWQEGVVDLAKYRGRRVVIRFAVRNSPDPWFNTWVYVDAVRLTE